MTGSFIVARKRSSIFLVHEATVTDNDVVLGDFVNWAKNISDVAEEVSEKVDETTKQIGDIKKEADESLKKLKRLQKDLQKTREDMSDTDELGFYIDSSIFK